MLDAALLVRLYPPRTVPFVVAVVAFGLLGTFSGQALGEPTPGREPWTVDSALRHLELYPDDNYAQFVALQLARREGPKELRRVAEILRLPTRFALGRNSRGQSVDLLNFTSGSLAVQESLQLDTMTADVAGQQTMERRVDRGRRGTFNGSMEDHRRLQQIALAIHAYQDRNHRFPPAASRDENGQPLLSWRVLILPFVEERRLYNQFRLDEPWDSPNNKKLVSQMPDIYWASNLGAQDRDHTTYQVPVAANTAFEGNKRVNLAKIRDGTSNTILLMQVDPQKASIWTKPGDAEIDFAKPFEAVLSGDSSWFDVALADGSVHSLPRTMGDDIFSKLLKRNDRSKVDWQGAYKNAPPREAARQGAGLDIRTLDKPSIKSHPFEEMLEGKTPRTSTLADSVPSDFYYVYARSPEKLLAIASDYQTWSSELFRQVFAKGEERPLVKPLLTQLGLAMEEEALRGLDRMVAEVAVVGSDVYVSQGSDVTLLVRLKEGSKARGPLEQMLATAQQEDASAKSTETAYKGVSYTHVTTPTRKLHVFSAFPRADLHIRSNSLAALKRIIDQLELSAEGVAAKDRVPSLGSTAEFRYMRTLFEYGADEEEVFVYLSDPFIRHLVGPSSKITELRRRQCFNHLQMIHYGTLLYFTEYGAMPKDIGQMVQAKCLPEGFTDGSIDCPDAGEYRLAHQGHTSCCSRHGCMDRMTPGCDIAAERVTFDEKKSYDQFLNNYNQYWRTYFDPIGVRIRHDATASRVETIILPLLDNSIYTTVSEVLGGKPVAIAEGPVSDEVVLSLGLTFDKDEVLDLGSPFDPEQKRNQLQQIALAVLNFESVNRQLPPPKGTGSQLSWRVHILPYLEQQSLYDQFRLDEPWDSPHNKALLKEMPEIYGGEGTETSILGFADPGVFGNRQGGLSLRHITDGVSNTLLAVDAGPENAVPWTKPQDLSLSPDVLLKSLGKMDPAGCVAVFVDGHVQFLPADITPEQLKAYVTYRGGEVIQRDPAPNQRPRPRIAIRQKDLEGSLRSMGVPSEEIERLNIGKFLQQGIGNHVSFHVCDADPAFSFNTLRFAGQLLGGQAGGIGSQFLFAVPLVNSLNAPVYVAWSVDDEQETDRILQELDDLLATASRSDSRNGFVPVNLDFYHLLGNEHSVRCIAWDFFGFRFRSFYARIGDHLVIATQPDVIEDLLQNPEPDSNSRKDSLAGHVQLRIQPQHWSRVMDELQLSWSEAGREACLGNLGPLNSAARLSSKAADKPAKAAFQAFGAHYSCPCGGHYQASGDNGQGAGSIVCSVHGDAAAPKQSQVVPETSTAAVITSTLGDITAALSFTEHGLRAVLEMKRQPATE